MATLIQLKDNLTQSSLTLVDGAVDTGYKSIAEGTGLGNVVRKPLMPQIFNNTGVLPTGVNIEMREQQVNLLIESDTIAGLQDLYDAIVVMNEKINAKGGGELAYRSESGTYVNYFRIAYAQVMQTSPLMEYDTFKRMRVTLSMTVNPIGMSAPMDIYDNFSRNTMSTSGKYNIGGSDWTAIAGSLSNVAIASSVTAFNYVLDAVNNLTTENVFIHTGTANQYCDVSVQIKHTLGTTLSGYKAGVVLRYIDASNYLEAYVDDDGASSRIRIDKIVAGVRTNMASTALTRLVVSTTYWIEAKIVGNTVTAEHWTSEPTPMGTDSAQATDTFDLTEMNTFGFYPLATEGRPVGLVWTPQQTSSFIDYFQVKAYSYREMTFPRVINIEGAWGGKCDALAGVTYTALGGTAPISMLYAWWPTVAPHNMIWNGGAESIGTSATVAYGWVATAVAGVIGAATSITRTTTASSVRSGTGAFEVITPATTDTGASFRIYKRGGFKKGRWYAAGCYARSASGTTAIRVKLGLSGDLSTGSAVALTTSWQLYASLPWLCTADTDTAYFAIGVNAATATTFQFDDAYVYEAISFAAPAMPDLGGSMLGGHGPGIIAGASYNLATASIAGGTAWTQTTDADYLLGVGPQASGALSTNGNLDFPILPHLFTPDDYSGDEVDVAVFARVELASTQTSLNCAISIASERGTSFGARRYGNFRIAGRLLKLPSSGTVFRPFYLGTITIKVDRQRPRREWLRLSFTNSGAATGTVGLDYLIVVPVRNVARSRSGTAASIIPSFISSTAETTKSIGIGSNGMVAHSLAGGVVEHSNGGSVTPDDGLLGSPIILPKDGAELLVWPSDVHVDATDSVATGMAKTFSGSLQVAVQPRHELMRQS